ncbi:MAG: hypothetical protein JST82_02535 [Bacteroidetes bacterium]|nr:hypothetical protein [Bacteroidota bacterium]
MGTPTNNLWQLIHSLTPQEKLFFKRDYLKTYNFSGNEPLYLQLFDQVNKQTTYNEQKLLKQLAPGLTLKNISYTKNYLYEQLCEALVIFHNHENQEANIFRSLSLIRIFREKEQYKTALKIWEHAIEQAKEFEHYPLMLQLQEEYRKIQLYNNSNIKYASLSKEYNNISISTEEYLKLIQLQEIHFRAQLLRRKTHFKQTKSEKQLIAQMLTDPLLQSVPEKASFYYMHYYNMAMATLLYMQNNASAYTYAYRAINKWQSSPQHISYDQENYMEVLYIFYYTAILAKDYEHILTVMDHETNARIKGNAKRAYFETIKHLALNRVYNKLADYRAVRLLVNDMKQHASEWEQHINTDLQRTLRLSIGISCFVLQDYDDAYHYVKNALLLFNDDTRKEHYSFAHLFLLLICFEKKDDYLFDLQYKSTYSYFYRHESPLPFEKTILQELNKTYLAKSFKELQKNFTQLQQSLKLTSSDPVQQMVFSMFNVPLWVESKLNRIPYQDWVVKKVKDVLEEKQSA